MSGRRRKAIERDVRIELKARLTKAQLDSYGPRLPDFVRHLRLAKKAWKRHGEDGDQHDTRVHQIARRLWERDKRLDRKRPRART